MGILNALLEISIYAAIIITVTMLLKAVFKHCMSPWLQYAVWFVLIVRLMLPVTVESGFHMFTAPMQTQSETAAMPDPQSAAPIVADDRRPDAIANSEAQPVKANSADAGEVSPVLSPVPTTNKPLSTENVLLIVWISGMGVSLVYIIVLYATLRLRVRRNAAEPSAHLLSLFEEVTADMDIRARLKLVCQYEYGTPALLLPRTVLMPVDTLVVMSDEQVKFAFRHELTHYRHGDHITCLLICLLNAIYWFNPFVWLAFRQMRTDMEVACDGAVVKSLDVPDKSRYASLIVGLFAQPDRRQLVLGMAQGNAKKIAEQRVRGIFKEAKSHASVKFVSALVAALLLLTCFTTACQPTPETPVVVNKGDNHLEEMIASSAPSAVPSPSPSEKATLSKEDLAALKQALRESVGAPETYADSFANDKGDVTVTFDAEIAVPAVSGLPAAAVTMNGFTQDRVDKLAAYFLGDTPVYTEEYVRTKDEIMDDIVRNRQRIERMSEEPEDETANIIKNVKIDIAELEEEYKTAPDHRNRTPATTALQNNEFGTILSLIADLGKDEAAMFNTINYANGSQFYFNNDGDGLYYPSLHRAEALNGLPRGMTMKREDAEQMVLKCISDLGIDDMQIANVQAQNFLITRDDINDKEYLKTANQCYVFTLTKTVKSIPVLLINTSVPLDSDDPNAPAHQEPEYTSISDPEHINAYVDDTGIVRFEWFEPTDISSILSDQVTLLPFKDIAERAKNNIFYKNYTAYGSTADITIIRIELNMMRIMRKDKPGEYLIVPVWDFIGDVQKSTDSELSRQSPPEEMSFVTINAIDGSWINRSWGY